MVGLGANILRRVYYGQTYNPRARGEPRANICPWVLRVGGSKGKPKRKEDVQEASSHYARYLEHQEKIHHQPDSLSVPHWKTEKRNFLSRTNFYLKRARMDIDDLVK